MAGGAIPLPNTPQIQAMRKFMTDEEIAEVLIADKQIDRGEKLFELDEELKAGAKKARQADRKPTERKPRERKEDFDKAMLLEQLTNAIGASPINAEVKILNSEREFLFSYNGRKFKVVLSCPRS